MTTVFLVFDNGVEASDRSVIGVTSTQSVAIDLAMSFPKIADDCNTHANPRAFCALVYTEPFVVLTNAKSH